MQPGPKVLVPAHKGYMLAQRYDILRPGWCDDLLRRGHLFPAHPTALEPQHPSRQEAGSLRRVSAWVVDHRLLHPSHGADWNPSHDWKLNNASLMGRYRTERRREYRPVIPDFTG